MATTTRVKQWGFGTAGDYTLADDAAIAASVLSMTAPQYSLPFGGQRWSVVPDGGHYDGNGDLVLQNGVVYAAHESGVDLSAADGWFVFWAKRGSQVSGKKLEAYFRYDSLGGAKLIADMVDGTGGRILNSDAGVAVRDTEWLDDWPESETWRAFTVRFVGDNATFRMSDYREIVSHTVDRTAAGTLALTQDDANNPITVGNHGAHAEPFFAYRRTGTCELKAANAYTIPFGTTALGRLTLVADRLGGGTEPLDLAVEFKIDSGAWTALPADGDLSGESFTAGTSTLLWRLSEMDNANDCRYVPSVYAVVLTYEQTAPDWTEGGQLKDVLKNIKAALNADATLQAYEGWSGVYVGWQETMNFKFYHRCGCVIEWAETPEEDQSNAREAGQLVWGKDEQHNVLVRVAMRPTRPIENMITDDDQLLDLTEDVLTVLRCETLSDTVARVKVASRKPSLEALESGGGEGEPEDLLLMVDIEVEVQGKLITAVRP